MTASGSGGSSVPAAERSLLLTCEHGGNRVPREYRALFRGREALLASHRGWDPGALAVGRSLARALDAELIAATTTRLLVDLNRSAHNPAVFSELSRGLTRDRRDALLARTTALTGTASGRRSPREAGASCTSPCTASLPSGAVRSATSRSGSSTTRSGLASAPWRSAWQRRLRAELPHLGVRRNAPYRGNADGLTTALRREFPAQRYLGLELELNQRAIATVAQRRALAAVLASTLDAALGKPA